VIGAGISRDPQMSPPADLSQLSRRSKKKLISYSSKIMTYVSLNKSSSTVIHVGLEKYIAALFLPQNVFAFIQKRKL